MEKPRVIKPVIYRGRLYGVGEEVSADPETLREWRENGIVTSDDPTVDDGYADELEQALESAANRIRELEKQLTRLQKQSSDQQVPVQDGNSADDSQVSELRAEGINDAPRTENAETQPDPTDQSGADEESDTEIPISQSAQAESLSAPTPPGLVEGGSGAEGVMPGRDSRKKRVK
ncbi:MAG: hypothetical protein ACK5LX_10270 [Oscillospiraceae bacterium]